MGLETNKLPISRESMPDAVFSAIQNMDTSHVSTPAACSKNVSSVTRKAACLVELHQGHWQSFMLPIK